MIFIRCRYFENYVHMKHRKKNTVWDFIRVGCNSLTEIKTMTLKKSVLTETSTSSIYFSGSLNWIKRTQKPLEISWATHFFQSSRLAMKCVDMMTFSRIVNQMELLLSNYLKWIYTKIIDVIDAEKLSNEWHQKEQNIQQTITEKSSLP